jgi:hypothetical protein
MSGLQGIEKAEVKKIFRENERFAGVGPAFAPARAGQTPPYNSPTRTPHFCDRHAARRTDRASGERDRSNFARDSLPAARSRSKEVLSSCEIAQTTKVVDWRPKARFAA